MKKCTKCQETKQYSEFYKSSRSPSGFMPRCITCTNLLQKEYRNKNLEKHKLARKKYYNKNIIKIRVTKLTYSHKPEAKKKKSLYDIVYRVINKNKIKQYKKDWENKNKDSPDFKIKRNLRRRLHHALKGNLKADKTFSLLGCDISFLKNYLANMFKEGMTWENYGPIWHIDHIIPCCSFDLTIENEQKKCFHYSNLQPLFVKENLKKGRKFHLS